MAIGRDDVVQTSKFIDSIGLNVHMGYFDTPYRDAASVIEKLNYLGVSNVRDSSAWEGTIPNLSELGQAGVHLNLLIGGHGDNLEVQFSTLEELAPYLATVEGPNEVNFWQVTYQGETGVSAAVAQQKYISQWLNENQTLKDIPLIGFTVASSSPEEFAQYGDTSAVNDYGNAHVYFEAGTAPHLTLQTYVDMAGKLTPGDAMFLTESGFPSFDGNGNQGISETAQAKYTLSLLLDSYKSGVVRTFLYELLDSFSDPTNADQEAHYGMFRHDGSAKPVAEAIHNLTSILSDTAGAASDLKAGSLDYTLTGLPSTASSMLMQKANGVFDLIVWNEPTVWQDETGTDLSVASRQVLVELGGIYQTVRVYDPLVSNAAIKTYHGVSSILMDLTDHALVVEVEPLLIANPGPPQAPPAILDQAIEHSILLSLSGDAWEGDARIAILVDGQQSGAEISLHALHKQGQTQDVMLKGFWAAGSHTITVQLLNDASGGSADQDRNAYVHQITVDGDMLLPRTSSVGYGARDYVFDVATRFDTTQPSGVVLHGTAGNDLLAGGTGNDSLYGLAGTDKLVGGAGADLLDGGLGRDTADYAKSHEGVTVDLAAGTASGGDAQGDRLISIERLSGSAFHDVLTGDAEANILQGQGGGDLLSGSDGNDKLYGQAGTDRLIGGQGADLLDGGEGQDRADYSLSQAAVSINLAAGTASGGDAQGDTLVSIEQLIGSAFNDVLTGDGQANILYGKNGNDVLQGGAGNDVLIGGRGADRLYGGSDADTFRWTSVKDSVPGSADKVMDFSQAQHDKLDMSFLDLTLASTTWQRVGASEMHVYVDTNSDARPEMEIVLVGISVLHTSDFIF